MTVGYVTITRAHCKNCGDKRAMRVKIGQRVVERDLPITTNATAVERTPWVCECGRKIELDIELVEEDRW